MSTLSPEIEKAVRLALAASWSEHTQPGFDPQWPSYNQCAQTAIVVFERFGGEILRTTALTTDGREIEHFYNRIGGDRYDFAEGQFLIPGYWQPICYRDIPSTTTEACANLRSGQLDALREAFSRAMEFANAV